MEAGVSDDVWASPLCWTENKPLDLEGGMTILKFAVVTCAFYISAALLMEILITVLARLSGGIGFYASSVESVGKWQG
jgi:hypothetical protein